MTSDGAFEIFNEKGEILGEQKFLEWIEESAHLSSEGQKNLLMEHIKHYSYEQGMIDDISILIMDINLQV